MIYFYRGGSATQKYISFKGQAQGGATEERYILLFARPLVEIVFIFPPVCPRCVSFKYEMI